MAATTILGSKPLEGARTFLPKVRRTTPIAFEVAANDSKSPKSDRSQVTSESGRL